MIAFKHAFHGRTSAAVRVTDNPKIIAPVNEGSSGYLSSIERRFRRRGRVEEGDVSSVIIEGIQGVGGIQLPTDDFMRELRNLCTAYDACLILDEIQSGYGRSGKFFCASICRYQAGFDLSSERYRQWLPDGWVIDQARNSKPVYGMLRHFRSGNHLTARPLSPFLI